jgi:hypothetical protein
MTANNRKHHLPFIDYLSVAACFRPNTWQWAS